jgi:hypothetical protein
MLPLRIGRPAGRGAGSGVLSSVRTAVDDNPVRCYVEYGLKTGGSRESRHLTVAISKPVRLGANMTDKNDSDSLGSKVQNSFKRLSAAAISLNNASDELGKSIAELDAKLKKLNLGVSTWVRISGGEDPNNGLHWSDDLGYDKINGRWGIALGSASGDYSYPDGDAVERWLFNDGPRRLRIEAVEKIPVLLDKLVAEAGETTKKILAKAEMARQLAVAIEDGASAPASQRK